MTPEQKALVRQSWAVLSEDADVTMRAFYARLFEVNPSSRRLFRNKEMRVQRTAFAQMLAFFIRSLDDTEPGFTEAIEASGRRHVGYGVMHSDYEAVGDALVWAIGAAHGPDFTDELRDAWEQAYRSLVTRMRPVSGVVL